MDPAALAILETIKLPALTPAARRNYERNMQGAEHASLNELHRQLELSDAEIALRDPGLPDGELDRIARAYFRCAAWEALVGNYLTEYQKSWRVNQAKAKKQAPILAAWAASSDPHAPLIRELQAALPRASALEIAKHVATICHGWTLATPDSEEDYSPSPKVVRRDLAALAANPAIVGAVQRWLPTLDTADYERRVLHAGTLLAASGTGASAALLAPLLDEADGWSDANDAEFPCGQAWVRAVWGKCAPAKSAVAALLAGQPVPPEGRTAKPVAKKAKPVAKKAKPVAKTAKPVAKTAKPVAKKAKPVAKKAKPVAKKTKPGAQKK